LKWSLELSHLILLYDNDYANWTARTADRLRQGRFADLDIEHLLEELDDLGKIQRHELVNRRRVLLSHLLKWQYQYRQISKRWAEFEGYRIPWPRLTARPWILQLTRPDCP
jgi:hypothetical protein